MELSATGSFLQRWWDVMSYAFFGGDDKERIKRRGEPASWIKRNASVSNNGSSGTPEWIKEWDVL